MKENTPEYRINKIINGEDSWTIYSDDGVVISFLKEKLSQGTLSLSITLRFPYGNEKGFKIYKMFKSALRPVSLEPTVKLEMMMIVKYQAITPAGRKILLECFGRIPTLFKGFTVSDKWSEKKSTFSDGLTKKMVKKLTEEGE